VDHTDLLGGKRPMGRGGLPPREFLRSAALPGHSTVVLAQSDMEVRSPRRLLACRISNVCGLFKHAE